MRLLYFPEPGDGGTPQAEANQTAEQINAGQTGRAAPIAAVIVRDGEVTEELLKTKAELEEERRARKKAETDAAHHADEARRLKEAGVKPTTTEPAKPQRTALERFMDGEDV